MQTDAIWSHNQTKASSIKDVYKEYLIQTPFLLSAFGFCPITPLEDVRI